MRSRDRVLDREARAQAIADGLELPRALLGAVAGHDPVAKGRGGRSRAVCAGCLGREIARGSRAHVNRAARLHRKLRA